MTDILNRTVPDYLIKILESKKESLSEQKRKISIHQMKELAKEAPVPMKFTSRFRKDKINIIAEMKKASPSQGLIRPELDCARLAAEFEKEGASALSVLTEEQYFQGSAENILKARCSSLPILRKDFIFDEYQIDEAKSLGASAVLLIAALLSSEQLRHLTLYAQEIGLSVLAEAHNINEVETLLEIPVDLIGINARNLRTFETSLTATAELLPLIPRDRFPIAESAIKSVADIHLLQQAGAVGFLIGETLMRASDPAQKLKELLK